ncbi:hypothetical protein [Lactiplantibacillus daowaiensis]|uniref:Uncharacterized protein n=1 Tax=Lactiplantibacillus daowaiensis TaxID=2559918 RepID=A0ABW1S1M6_9LACO|nr:hypothetical protein [Lactiplantibacillus daowaiensis]
MKNKQVLALSATVLATLAMGATTLTANAATTYQRSKITKVAAKAYYAQRQTGKTYQLKGTTKKATLKANHALKNYTKATWTATKKTKLTQNGKQYLYYYVKSSKNGASGWVNSKYLAVGRNFQATTATSTSVTKLAVAKAGKYYSLNGSNAYVKFSHGVALNSDATYTQSQQRYVYKAGKKYLYYYVTSADGKATGWVWHGYLKAATDSSVTTTGTVNNTTTTEKFSESNKTTNETGNSDSNNTESNNSGLNIVKRSTFLQNLDDNQTYAPGVYIEGQLYTNIHYVVDEYNHQSLFGDHDGKTVDTGYGPWDTIFLANGDVLSDVDTFYSTSAPIDGFNPMQGTSDKATYTWQQYHAPGYTYTEWQFNVVTKKWDQGRVLRIYTD